MSAFPPHWFLAALTVVLVTGCAAPAMPVPPRSRTVIVDALPAAAAPAPLVAYSFSSNCEAGLGALSRTVDSNRAALCAGFNAALGAVVNVLSHERGRFEAPHAGTPEEESGAAYRLVIRVIPEQYPGGRRDQGLGRGLRQRYVGELMVAARLYRIADGALLRDIRYNGRVIGFTYERERFEAVGREVGMRVARDIGAR